MYVYPCMYSCIRCGFSSTTGVVFNVDEGTKFFDYKMPCLQKCKQLFLIIKSYAWNDMRVYAFVWLCICMCLHAYMYKFECHYRLLGGGFKNRRLLGHTDGFTAVHITSAQQRGVVRHGKWVTLEMC